VLDFSAAKISLPDAVRIVEEIPGVEEVDVEESRLGNVIVPCQVFPLSAGGGRAVVIRGSVVKGMVERLEEMLGEASLSALLYYSGYDYGLSAYEDQKKFLPSGDVSLAVETAAKVGSVMGFGFFKVISLDPEKKRAIVRLERSFECEAARERGLKGKKTAVIISKITNNPFNPIRNI